MKQFFLSILFFLFSTPIFATEAIMITIPEVPKVEATVPKTPQVIQNGNTQTNEEILKEFTAEKVVTFSDKVAPIYQYQKEDTNETTGVGEVANGDISAYLHAPLLTAQELTEKLTQAGFTILETYKIDKKGAVRSIVYTNDTLSNLAAKKNRGFAASLRVTIDTKNSLTSFVNPLYLLAAFMQEEYNSKQAKAILKMLTDTFKDLKNSQEMVKFRILERYQFMHGMPQYKDMQIIQEADSAQLLTNARKSKKVLFEQKLANGATLLGVKLSKRTSKFVKKIGYTNAGLLPYPILIEENQAKILDPKYYIAIMYPKLKMSQFMTIATTPGAISKDIDKLLR